VPRLADTGQARPPITRDITLRTLAERNRIWGKLRRAVRAFALSVLMVFCPALCFAQSQLPDPPESKTDNQINVNWFYGAYVPREVPLRPLEADERFKLYLRQTYTTLGIYLKTTLFTLGDQAHDRYPEWGDGFDGFAKRFGTRQAEFAVQNSVIALGDGLLGWEPRYDRCQCKGFWPRTRHAIVRGFVTYDRTEENLRPQLFTYLGAFTGAVTATAWEPGHNPWQVKGYQAAIGQVPIGVGINWIGEFAPEIARVFHKHKEID
jgi:hypothetical protein